MALLAVLGDLQRVVAAAEIGAGVLPVLVEEEVVEPAAQVVVVRHVLARRAQRVVLVEVPPHRGQPAGQRAVAWAVHLGGVAPHRIEEVVERAFLEDEIAVGIGLAEIEIGIDQQSYNFV